MLQLSFVCLVSTLTCAVPIAAQAGAQSSSQQSPQSRPPAQNLPAQSQSQHELAQQQLKQQEKQRILGILPEFNTSNIADAAPLSPKQKFELGFKSATDPFVFVFSGIDAGISQWEDDFPGYGQGAVGYAKRFGASYADTFDGTMLGNAVFPVLLHQDPRYFRKGTGSFKSRLGRALVSTVVCKGDNGRWQPNYSNVLGNFAAGGISNLYYPASDRGAELTAWRALTVTGEGAIGAIFYEFWPDISRKLARKHHAQP